jgi:hypothetical protein
MGCIQHICISGSLLSDLSYSRSEDDLDSTLTRCGKVLKKHRPSLAAGDDPPSAKRRCPAVEKTVQVGFEDLVALVMKHFSF